MLKGTAMELRYNRILERALVPLLTQVGLKPDHVSILGLFCSLLAGVSFAFYPLLGGIFTLLTGLLDTLDGSLARATGQSKKFGAFLDSVLDRYTELIIYLGIWCYFYRQGSTSPYFSLTFLLILFGFLIMVVQSIFTIVFLRIMLPKLSIDGKAFAFHGSPGHALWYGWSEMQRDLVEIRAAAREMRRASGRPAADAPGRR